MKFSKVKSEKELQTDSLKGAREQERVRKRERESMRESKTKK